MDSPVSSTPQAGRATQGGCCIDRTLTDKASETLRILRDQELTAITAESCTAGLLSAVLSHGEGASSLLHGGFVTYTKANKAQALGVAADEMRVAGTVNAEVALQMAAGALEHSPADIAIAVTGVLGPDPDEDGNPVGLVYYCCQRRGQKGFVESKDYGTMPHHHLLHVTVMDALTLLERCASDKPSD
jgi:nicotinamide-nucleotide amidase